MSSPRPGGFTLVELLVALALFAVLSVLSYGGLRHVMNLDAGLANAVARHTDLELAFLLIEQDLHATVARGVRDELGGSEPALRAGLDGDLVSLTRRTADLSMSTPGAALARVRYRLVGGVLYRDVWAQLDRTPTTAYRARRLLDGIEGLDLRFFGSETWSPFWPRPDSTPQGDTLPDGAEITIDFGRGRSVRRVLVRAG